MSTLQDGKGAGSTLRRNICTGGDLVNGATGIIVGFALPVRHKEEEQQSCRLRISSYDCRVGRKCSAFANPLSVQAQQLSGAKVASLGLSSASTPLSWLGLSISIKCNLDKAVIDLGQSVFAHGQAYTVLSRVTSSGVILGGLI